MKLSGDVRAIHDQDGAIILDTREGHLFRLNLVGSRVLELLRAGRTKADIIEEIARQFQAERDVVETDIGEFIERLEKYALISDAPPVTGQALYS